jgi:hypothetical protein
VSIHHEGQICHYQARVNGVDVGLAASSEMQRQNEHILKKARSKASVNYYDFHEVLTTSVLFSNFL